MIKCLGEIVGHNKVVDSLKKAVSGGRVAHAYLFAGPPGVGKETVALAFARALLCENSGRGDSCGGCVSCRQADQGIHPDLVFTRPAGATIKIDQVRQMQREIQPGPHTGRWSVRIVAGADTMTPEASNSLLKTLEEPSPGVVFIMLTARPQALLPTVLSRCQQIYFQPLTEAELARGLSLAGLSGGAGRVPLALAGGSLGRAMALAGGEGAAEREQIIELAGVLVRAGCPEVLTVVDRLGDDRKNIGAQLDLLMLWYRDIMLEIEAPGSKYMANRDRAGEIAGMALFYTTGRIMEMITHIEQAKGALAAGANLRLALESLLLRLAGISGGTGPAGGGSFYNALPGSGG